MISCFWVGLGGLIGTLARFGISTFAISRWSEGLPWATLLINVGGSFAIGFFATLTTADGRYAATPLMRHFFMTGVCGGFTTFSSFSLQTMNFAQAGRWNSASLYVFSSVVLCLLAVWIGSIVASAINIVK